MNLSLKGVYILILKLEENKEIKVGKLGKFKFKKGFYAYVGSANGNGGFKRIIRHFNIASGKNKIRRWHIDYLLSESIVVCALLYPKDKSFECIFAKKLSEFLTQIKGFGCSDCKCNSHLFFSETDIIDVCKKINENESIIIRPNN